MINYSIIQISEHNIWNQLEENESMGCGWKTMVLKTGPDRPVRPVQPGTGA
jgi:hypothetical protein